MSVYLVLGTHYAGKESFNLAFTVVRCRRFLSCLLRHLATFFAPLNSVGY